MGARRYSAATGRFLQVDLYYDALSNLGLSEDPLTQNRYALAGANPINFVEVDGHAAGPLQYCLHAKRAGIRSPYQALCDAMRQRDTTSLLTIIKRAALIAVKWGPAVVGGTCLVASIAGTGGTTIVACAIVASATEVLLTAAVAARDRSARGLGGAGISYVDHVCSIVGAAGRGATQKQVAQACSAFAQALGVSEKRRATGSARASSGPGPGRREPDVILPAPRRPGGSGGGRLLAL